ncbi:hypothetical protein LOZ12_004657 [Ophidiomyces ophidiicola]|uniref:Uncharacterized protein n=1 Tax=Ophidiomyces ophidiicola TaxID=1387563 RepID=A0ACB8USE0_9EURO|nr:hypothetical protein LOZ64_004959 [Ophidiomyces ophidiicola]KAI1943138.1 hypothetical protein LOZ62_004383 [Ophidiomyces ophidiicola]KAI1969905.1 hypothetical protein LOZ56_004075 [Ophidiomyces ophidiicola]KAI2002456.1 hypothetical protein LOZ50_004983 [Ophidiomyces ophidiicola]KAI2019988.1 hypothetical protein LOZ45_005315 [Ophidiomyces ophidiicola]
MDQRASIPVTTPRDNPTLSYWQTPPDEIANLRSTPQIPETADLVIIGSGITGASTAFNVLSRAPETKIVMLEARQACSGATGRNGGHTKPASYTSFPANVQKLGLEEAIKIVKLEYNTLRGVHSFARQHNIPCDSEEVDTVDIVYDQTAWKNSLSSIEFMKKHLPGEPYSDYTIWSGKDAEEKFLCPGALGAITYAAGSMSGYKLVIGILKMCLKKGLNLQTNTLVTRLSRQDDGWVAETSRGTIRAPKIIMATNGYTAAIYPKLQGVIMPLRGQMTAHRPGTNMPKDGLKTTYSFVYKGGFDFMIPRPQGSKHAGDIVIGGGFITGKDEGLHECGTVDDTVCDPVIMDYLTATTERFFGKNWGEDDPAGRIRSKWTGIMGYSADGHPLIGEMPGDPGLYICASFQGHGMALCFLCAQAFTSMIFGDDEKSIYTWLPKAYKVTPERLQLKVNGEISHSATAPSTDI